MHFSCLKPAEMYNFIIIFQQNTMAVIPQMKLKIIFNLLFILSFNLIFAQDEVIDLWDNSIPGSIASES